MPLLLPPRPPQARPITSVSSADLTNNVPSTTLPRPPASFSQSSRPTHVLLIASPSANSNGPATQPNATKPQTSPGTKKRRKSDQTPDPSPTKKTKTSPSNWIHLPTSEAGLVTTSSSGTQTTPPRPNATPNSNANTAMISSLNSQQSSPVLGFISNSTAHNVICSSPSAQRAPLGTTVMPGSFVNTVTTSSPNRQQMPPVLGSMIGYTAGPATNINPNSRRMPVGLGFPTKSPSPPKIPTPDAAVIPHLRLPGAQAEYEAQLRAKYSNSIYNGAYNHKYMQSNNSPYTPAGDRNQGGAYPQYLQHSLQAQITANVGGSRGQPTSHSPLNYISGPPQLSSHFIQLQHLEQVRRMQLAQQLAQSQAAREGRGKNQIPNMPQQKQQKQQKQHISQGPPQQVPQLSQRHPQQVQSIPQRQVVRETQNTQSTIYACSPPPQHNPHMPQSQGTNGEHSIRSGSTHSSPTADNPYKIYHGSSSSISIKTPTSRSTPVQPTQKPARRRSDNAFTSTVSQSIQPPQSAQVARVAQLAQVGQPVKVANTKSRNESTSAASPAPPPGYAPCTKAGFRSFAVDPKLGGPSSWHFVIAESGKKTVSKAEQKQEKPERDMFPFSLLMATGSVADLDYA